jgi:hypothetical protein
LPVPVAANTAAMNHDRYDDAYIGGILNSVKTIAIVGAWPTMSGRVSSC